MERARSILPQVGVAGEIGFLRYVVSDRRLIFPVSTAGMEAMIDVDLDTRAAIVTRRPMGAWERLSYLHKIPGPHNAAIRGNWAGTRVWTWLADSTIYLLLFITISGLYLWWAIKGERTIGLLIACAGAVTMFGLIFAILDGH